MIFARYLAHGEVAYGVVDGDIVKQITASPFEKFEVTDHTHPISGVKLLAPCQPAKIVAVGLSIGMILHITLDILTLQSIGIFYPLINIESSSF